MRRISIVSELLHMAKLCRFRRKLRNIYPDNDILPMNVFNVENIRIGRYSYGELNVVDFGGDCKLIIKNYVSIAQHVTFIVNAEHYVDHVSTYPFKVKVLLDEKPESFGKGDILIDDDVWIGYGATILSGVHIGQGAVIASGALVSKDVPPYSIVGGVPAKVIKYRFDKDVSDYLITLDYDKLDKETVREHIEDLYCKIECMELDEIKKIFQWFSKK